MQCQNCGLVLDPQQVAQTGRCPRCGVPVAVTQQPAQPDSYATLPGQQPSFPGAPGAYGQPPAPGGTAPYGQPGGTFASQPTFGESPTIGNPPQAPFSAPPVGMSGPPQPAFGGPPPGFGGPQPGFGGPQPGGQFAPPKKSRTGLIISIVVVLVLLIGGGTAAAFILHSKGSPQTKNPGGSPTATATVAPTATATTGVPTGFQTFTSQDGTFSVGYPPGWQPSGAAAGGVTIVGPGGQIFLLLVLPDTSSSPEILDSAFCQGTPGSGGGFGGTPTAPRSVTIGGQSWTQEECDNQDATAHAVVEAVIYKGNTFLLSYEASKATFDGDRSQYFGPMEQSFMFLK